MEQTINPVTRLEFYLAALSGMDVQPPSYVTRLEHYLQDIIDGNASAIVPVTRVEHYLAKISGADVEIPEPITRIEQYLAQIAGADIETPDPITREEYLLQAWAEGAGGDVVDTVSGNPAHITNALNRAALSVLATISPIQSGNGTPSPDNVRPISGRTGLSVYVGPTTEQADATNYPVNWQTEAGTVYGGYVNPVTGELVVDKTAQVITGNDLNIAQNIQPEGNLWRLTLATSRPHTTSSYSDALCNSYKVVRSYSAVNNTNGSVGLNNGTMNQILVRNDSFTTRQEIIDGLNASPIQLVYELATPLTYQLTPQEVELLLGENYVWSSAGDTVSVTYYAEGNTNTLQSLNILLGGNYSNPKTADDVSDNEALEIILGGNK